MTKNQITSNNPSRHLWPMNHGLWTFLIFLLPTLAQASPHYTFNQNTRTAYEKALSLRFDEAKILLAKERSSDPDNLITYYVENYIDFFSIFINEEETEFNRLKANKDRRLELIKQGNSNSPYYRYTQAEINLQWAIARFKFGEYVTGLREIKKAFSLLEENQKKFPQFVANKKSLGVLHAMIGTVPDNFKWAVKMVGMNGTIDQGLREIKEVIRYSKTNDFVFDKETVVMYGLLLLHIGNQSDEAWQILRSSKLDPKSNPLASFVMASVAQHTGRNDEAIRILQARPKGEAFLPFHFLDYMLGLSKLYRQDEDADRYFKRYTRSFKGKNYIKEAYQKLAWHSLLFENGQQYAYYISLAKTKGDDTIDGDKKALKEASYGPQPNAKLLMARLLFDGGYYDKAEQLLASTSPSAFKHSRDRLEYTYRLGRIYHKQKNYSEAKRQYQATIDKGADASYYFACNAAYQMGLIYEKERNYAQARSSFQNCLSMKPDEYKNSLHQKAKAGVNRLKNKS